MSEPFIGEIILFAGSFAPRGWALCNGQTLSIQQNQALFAIIGTTYGGNGTTTFNLPDLRGRVAVSAGQSPGLSSYTLGEQTGQENVTLLQSQMPTHNHLITANNDTSGVNTTPSGAFLSVTHANKSSTPYETYAASVATPATLNNGSIAMTGGSQPHTNIQPTLALNYIIALQGIFPTRD